MDDKHGEMIERIYNELVGDEYTEGLIPKVERMDKKLENHSILFRVVIGLFIALSGVIGLLLDILKII